MSLVDSNWDMWNIPLCAKGQRDAVHKCWCYCRNSRSFSVQHIWTPQNWEAWLWTFGKLNSPILGWGTQGTFDHGLFCESNASKKIAGCFIMIFLNCIGSFRTWSNNKLLEPAPCSPNCVQVECEYFRFCDLYVYVSLSLSLSLYICVYIHIQYVYIYIYIHTHIHTPVIPFPEFVPILCFLQSSLARITTAHHNSHPPAVVHWACRMHEAKLGGLGAVASPAHGIRDGQPSTERIRSRRKELGRNLLGPWEF